MKNSSCGVQTQQQGLSGRIGHLDYTPFTETPHRWLGPFVVKRQIRPIVYRLRLPHRMKQLHPVFNVVKLTLALDNPITGQKTENHPLPIVIDREVE